MRAGRDSEEALFPDAVALLHQPGRFEIHQWTIRLRDRLLLRTRNPSGRLCVGPVGGTGVDIERFASKDHPLRNHLHGLDLHQPLGLKRSSKESAFHYAPQERCHPAMPERKMQNSVFIIVVVCRVRRDFSRKRNNIVPAFKSGTKVSRRPCTTGKSWSFNAPFKRCPERQRDRF